MRWEIWKIEATQGIQNQRTTLPASREAETAAPNSARPEISRPFRHLALSTPSGEVSAAIAFGRPLKWRAPGYLGLLRATWRRFDTSSSPSASLAAAVHSLREVIGNFASIRSDF